MPPGTCGPASPQGADRGLTARPRARRGRHPRALPVVAHQARRRQSGIKGGRAAVRDTSTAAVPGPAADFLGPYARPADPTRERTMADAAYLTVTIAVFALVALVARGVTKL